MMKLRKMLAAVISLAIVCNVVYIAESPYIELNSFADSSEDSGASIQERAKSIIDSTGTDLHEIYSYITEHNKYQFMEYTRSLEEIEEVGWEYFAEYALNNRYGISYYIAAVSALLYETAGYETRIVKGTGRAKGSTSYWNQVLVDGEWVNYDACNSFEGVTNEYLETPKNPNSNGYGDTGQGYTIEQYVYHSFYNNSVKGDTIALGDPTGDGKVDSKDATFVLVEYALRSTNAEAEPLPPEIETAADVNRDGLVDARDGSTILRYYSYVSTGGKLPIEVYLGYADVVAPTP